MRIAPQKMQDWPGNAVILMDAMHAIRRCEPLGKAVNASAKGRVLPPGEPFFLDPGGPGNTCLSRLRFMRSVAKLGDETP